MKPSPAPQGLIDWCGYPADRAMIAAPQPANDDPTVISRAIRYLRDDAPKAVEGQGGDNTTYKVSCRLKDIGVSQATAAALMWEHWNPGCKPPWDLEELQRKVAHAYRYGFEQPGVANPVRAFTPVTAPAAPEIEPPPFSDDALATAMAEERPDLRYVALFGKWFLYRHGKWRPDETMEVYSIAREILRSFARSCNESSTKKRIASAATVAAVVGLARSDRRMAMTVDQWDADPWLMNTPAGEVDLRTGRMRPCRPESYFTKMTAVSPGGDCPLWLDVIRRCTGGSVELERFLQRVIGYCLTGLTIEHALFFLYGLGANGKGVILNTVSAILGDYATVASMETFCATGGDRHPTDLAMLRGARLVTAQETEAGRRWAEARIKSLTGGDKVSARFMRQDFFEFMPQFKLVIAGNHKPGLRNVDEAIRRRMNLVPFTVTIPKAERDPYLSEKLKAEWPGILQWAIEGCLMWQREGLAAPAEVVNATGEYLAAEDAMSLWLDECCDKAPGSWTSGAELYASWKAWADRSGELAGSRRRFSERISRPWITEGRKPGDGSRGFVGVMLKPTSEMFSSVTGGQHVDDVFA